MITKIPAVLGCILFTLLSTSANAAIVYLQDNRFISHTMASPSTMTPDTPYADFDQTWWAWEAGASQTSSLGNASMSGSGWSYAGYDAMLYGAVGTSRFAVTFTVDELTDFSLSGFLDTNWWDSDLSVSLTENNIELFGLSIWDLPDMGVNPFAVSGQFTAGNTYQLTLHSSSFDSDYYYETWNFNMTTVSAVPVPAAVWLFGSGLLALVGFARRKAN